MTQVFYHATSQALPQFPLLQKRLGDSFRDDPRLPGTRCKPGLGDCNTPSPPTPARAPSPTLNFAPTVSAPAHPLSRTPIAAHQLRPPQAWWALATPWGAPLGGPPDTHRRPGPSRGLGLDRKGGGAFAGQPRPQMGTTDQSVLAAAPCDPAPGAHRCPIKKSSLCAGPIRSWRSVPGVGKEPGRECAAVGGARA